VEKPKTGGGVRPMSLLTFGDLTEEELIRETHERKSDKKEARQSRRRLERLPTAFESIEMVHEMDMWLSPSCYWGSRN
jgi:hypothetical protein